MSDFYDRDGQPLTLDEWAAVMEDRDYRRVALTEVGGASVSTVWLGSDHNWSDDKGPPIIFETMIFGGPHDDFCERYSTEGQARAGHCSVVRALRDGVDP